MRAFKYYYRVAYTSVNIEHERIIYENINNLSTILYPPCPCPDSVEILKQRKSGNLRFNPALFSNYNFSKITGWNSILKNNKITGNKISQESFNSRLNFLLNDNYKLMKVKENTNRIKSPAKRMNLDLLLKVKAVL